MGKNPDFFEFDFHVFRVSQEQLRLATFSLMVSDEEDLENVIQQPLQYLVPVTKYPHSLSLLQELNKET